MTCLVYQREWIEAHREMGSQFVTVPLVDFERLVIMATDLEQRLKFAESELRRREREAGWNA
jgi:hypothetical protein